MKCDNFENDKCRYFTALQGTNEPLPTGCDPDIGDCFPLEDGGYEWDLVDEAGCDMIDMVEE